MPLFSFEGKTPKVHPTAFIAPTAVLIGDVTVEENASVWYNAVVRGDFSAIVIRRGANVQDCSVLHVTPRDGVEVGPGATVGHLCLVHGATIGEEALIGNGATVLD
ncbi:MAG: gamma carbonic anhydrase family protein, partial [Candidatus Rokuibacteriota bacterium]